MRALLIMLAVGLGLAAGWVGLEAQESEAEARARNTACLRDLSHPSLATLCSYERLWSVPRLTLAGVLAVGGVLALVGVAVTGLRLEVQVAAPPLTPAAPPTHASPPRLTPEAPLSSAEPFPGQVGADFDLARQRLAAAAARGFVIPPKEALRSARAQLGMPQDPA